jgi:hypothetical protein
MTSEYERMRALEDRWFSAFCKDRGLDPDLMRRPNYWWMGPRDLWKSHWLESEVPARERPNRRTLAQWLTRHAELKASKQEPAQ